MSLRNIIFGFSLVLMGLACGRNDNMDIELITTPEVDPTVTEFGDTITISTSRLNYVYYISPCYDFIYPLEVILDDGSVKLIESESDLFNAIIISKILTYNFPVVIEDEEGIKVINDMEALELEECNGAVPMVVQTSSCGCEPFKLVYPINAINQNGEQIVAMCFADLANFQSEWAVSLQSNDDFLEFIYPITLLDYSDNTFEAENLNEVIELINMFCE